MSIGRQNLRDIPLNYPPRVAAAIYFRRLSSVASLFLVASIFVFLAGAAFRDSNATGNWYIRPLLFLVISAATAAAFFAGMVIAVRAEILRLLNLMDQLEERSNRLMDIAKEQGADTGGIQAQLSEIASVRAELKTLRERTFGVKKLEDVEERIDSIRPLNKSGSAVAFG